MLSEAGRFLRNGAGAVALLAAAACAACVPRPLFQSPSRAVTGELLLETSSSEPRSYQPTACLSGNRFYFLGVDLEDPAADAVVRVVVDPLEGPLLRLTSPTGVLRLDRNSCSTFRVSIEPTGWWSTTPATSAVPWT